MNVNQSSPDQIASAVATAGAAIVQAGETVLLRDGTHVLVRPIHPDAPVCRALAFSAPARPRRLNNGYLQCGLERCRQPQSQRAHRQMNDCRFC